MKSTIGSTSPKANDTDLDLLYDTQKENFTHLVVYTRWSWVGLWYLADFLRLSELGTTRHLGLPCFGGFVVQILP